MTVYPAHGPIGMLSSPNREGKARHAGTGWVLASVIDKIWLSFFTVTFPSPLYPSPLYSQSIRRYTEVLHMLSMMVMASTMQSLLKKGASFFNTPSPSSEDASINNINITPDDDDDNDNDNDNDTDTDDGTCSFKIKTAPDSDRLFRKVDPAVDGEECIRDCASCTIRYPSKFDVDMKDKLYGNIGGWATHMLVATGKTDWVRDVADEKGSVMEAVERGGVEPSNGKLKLSASNIPVPDEYHYHEPGKQPTTVLLFPSFTIIDHVTPALTPDLIKYFVNPAATTTTPLTAPRLESTEETVSEASSEAGEGSQQPPHPQQQLETTKKTDIKSLTPLRSRPCPHSAVILLCSQRTRDVRCGQSAPLLRREFERHLRPLGLYRELDDERPGGVGIYFVSHVGGHKYAANVIVYRRRDFSNWYCKPAAAAAAAVDEGEGESSDQEEEEQGKTEEGASQGIWLARVRPEDCENIIRYTVLQGKVVKPGHQLRGGFDREKGLISW